MHGEVSKNKNEYLKLFAIPLYFIGYIELIEVN
jgi:hypothetical protein